MITSYTKQIFDKNLLKTLFIKRSKVAGALQKPKGVTVNCQSLFPMEKAIFSLSYGRILTCQ